MEESKTNNTGIKIVVGLTVGIAAYFAAKLLVSSLFAPPEPALQDNPAFNRIMTEVESVEREVEDAGSVEEALKVTAAAVRKTLPLKLDEFTEMIDAKAGPGRKLTYTYRLPGVIAAEVDREQFVNDQRPSLTAGYNGPGMKVFRDQKVEAIYRYNDENGDFIAEIVIAPPNQ